MRPSGSGAIVPSSRLGSRDARRGIGRRVFTSEVTRPFECTSFSESHPPEVVFEPMMPIACTPAVKPRVIVFVPPDCCPEGPPPDPLDDGARVVGAAHATTVIARTSGKPASLAMSREPNIFNLLAGLSPPPLADEG